jgi:hypothetical protein
VLLGYLEEGQKGQREHETNRTNDGLTVEENTLVVVEDQGQVTDTTALMRPSIRLSFNRRCGLGAGDKAARATYR